MPLAKRRLLLASLIIGSLLTGHLARAQSEPPPPAAASPTSWYGWQTLIVDGASVTLGVGVGGLDAGAGFATFLGGYVLGGPIVHLAHRRPLVALGSLGLRVGAPLVLGALGATLGYAASGGREDDDGIIVGLVYGGLGGVFVGSVAAVVIDSAVLAHEPDDAPRAPPGALPASGVTWAPAFGLVRDARSGGSSAPGTSLRGVDGATFGVRGTF